MIKSTEQLRGMRGNYATYEDLVMRCCDIADEIEQEIEERYIELPKDENGKTVRYGGYAKVYPYDGEPMKVRALCRSGFGWSVVFTDGSKEPLYRVLVCEPPTVEDVLRDFAYCFEEGATEQSIDEIIAEYAAKLQLRKEQ